MPAELLRPHAVDLFEVAAGERSALFGVLIGIVAETDLDRVHPEPGGHFVDGGFEREGADGFPGRAHERIRNRVERNDFLAEIEVVGGVQMPRGKRKLFGVFVRGGSGGDTGVDQRGEVAGLIDADRDTLFRGGPSAHDAEDALAGKGQFDRSFGDFRRERAELHVAPHGALAAKAAADEGRENANVFLRQREHFGQRVAHALDELRRGVNRKVIAVPDRRGGVHFDGIVVVAGRDIDLVGLIRRFGKGCFRIAPANLGILPHHVFRHGCVDLFVHERDVGGLLLVLDADQTAGVFGAFQRVGDDHGDRLAIPVNRVGIENVRFAAGGFAAALHAEERRIHHLRRVLMRQHGDYAAGAFGLADVNAFDGALRDAAVDERGVREVVQRVLGREAGVTGDLFHRVEAVDRLSHDTLRIAQLIAIAIGDEADDGFSDFGNDTH